MATLRALSSSVTLAVVLFSAASSLPHQPPLLPPPPARTCPTVTPAPNFETSLVEGEWFVPNPYQCSKSTITFIANGRVRVTKHFGLEEMESKTFEMTTSGVFSAPETQLSLVHIKPEKFLIFHACPKTGPAAATNTLMALLGSSVTSQDIIDLNSEMERLALRQDMQPSTSVLPAMSSGCLPDIPTPTEVLTRALMAMMMRA